MIVAVWEDFTLLVRMVYLPDVAPPGMVTVAGIIAAGLLELIATTSPPDGAGLDRPSERPTDPPPTVVDGLRTSEVTLGATILNVESILDAPEVAVIVMELSFAMGTGLTVKVAEDFPGGTVTEMGNDAAAPVELSETTRPPFGAG